ncbi:hypothetical protein PR003_g32064 [Phytophthora rubi]|uniref:SMP domain-containing protein n=1 Tax=Phytophthora rubi TaxID=129364 RepID=A0A6A3GME3_9STRA|nr:hypothetical protein PR002_g30834 [Phytophthora rubi]KAE8958714.1 hypothetical protein PR001_g30964 [Phytophthora rubi]KAE9266614.1 hypothetical protein PR003_g32064 [Phytophthora rubi]
MDSSNNIPAATPTVKPGLSIKAAIEASTSTSGAKFAQKTGEATLPSNQDGDGSPDEARKSALEKQFIPSQTMTGLSRPLFFRR